MIKNKKDLTPQQAQEKIDRMRAIYKDFLKDLEQLKKKQDQIINNFARALEKKKIKQIRKDLE
ncbi:MAG: hypothetical protein PHS07_02065 [Patescibacteria group bacterium]|jgi:hypothetical protein|nr:hypothetical protein [Patescibacteria group bacterium]